MLPVTSAMAWMRYVSGPTWLPRLAGSLLWHLRSNWLPEPHDRSGRAQRERVGGRSYCRRVLNIPLNHLHDRAGEIEKGRPVVVHCEGGYRSAIAASVLANAGRPDVLDMVGGFKAWAASKLPVQVETTVGTGA